MPSLLSSVENLPISLFTYLLLLNVGLAWVAHKTRWRVLTILTLVFTGIYEWGWVIKFLDESQLSLAMGIFLLFSIVSFAALTLGQRRAGGKGAMELTISRAGIAASTMPLVFAIFLAAVPQYGAYTGLLFAFLFVIDAGLLAVSIVRKEELLHAIGAAASVLGTAIWLAASYSSAGWTRATIGVAALVTLYAFGDAIARR